jgi:hypothetical protein
MGGGKVHAAGSYYLIQLALLLLGAIVVQSVPADCLHLHAQVLAMGQTGDEIKRKERKEVGGECMSMCTTLFN